ncbi:L,D-transpeptidase family protein [Maricaulis parjimensis]|uniref:L,D-transpeptidase family protein n=1 Tax=Maricaulis parjimensis TaxID=144023 RepID=UPI001939B8F7|nr:L,D-transpeptidase family protein [Maricaulis parjimensis]
MLSDVGRIWSGGAVLKFWLSVLMLLSLAAGPVLAWQDPAASGEEGVEAAEEPARPDYVRLDVWAQRLSGWTPQTIATLADLLHDAPSHGLPDQGPVADALMDPNRSLAERRDLASRAALRYAGWLEYGLMDPEQYGPRGLYQNEASYLVSRLQDGLDEGRLVPVFAEREPQVRDYGILRMEMLRMLTLRPIWPEIAPGSSLRFGDSGVRVDQLRARLAAEGLLLADWEEGAPYDTRLETAVRRYQGRVNLSPTGRLDQPTLRQLNISPQQRIDQLQANLEQRRWRTRQLGQRHIWVNLADFRLEAWRDGRLEREHEVMIGGQASSTPEFSEEMQYIVLNPWWGLPAGSARSRFQSMRRNPRIADQYGFRIFNASGQAISVYEIDWSRWGDSWPYRMSQPPGPTNPMGEVKFIFPNRHNVYIHDTIERDRFVRTRRDFSAGCIRVQDPLALAEWVLDGQDGWSRERIDSVVSGSDPTVVWLDNRIPVHIAYWTVVGDTDGRVRYLHDLYRRDSRVIEAYAEQVDAFAESFPVPRSGQGVTGVSVRR